MWEQEEELLKFIATLIVQILLDEEREDPTIG